MTWAGIALWIAVSTAYFGLWCGLLAIAARMDRRGGAVWRR